MIQMSRDNLGDKNKQTKMFKIIDHRPHSGKQREIIDWMRWKTKTL